MDFRGIFYLLTVCRFDAGNSISHHGIPMVTGLNFALRAEVFKTCPIFEIHGLVTEIWPLECEAELSKKHQNVVFMDFGFNSRASASFSRWPFDGFRPSDRF